MATKRIERDEYPVSFGIGDIDDAKQNAALKALLGVRMGVSHCLYKIHTASRRYDYNMRQSFHARRAAVRICLSR